jgi:RNA polymerase sigma factor (sigma-70 family)
LSRVPRFQTTLWSEIARAGAGNLAAMNDFLRRYQGPVYEYLVARGLQAADAEDVTQDVFQRILQADLLRKADQERGRFRSLLLGITKNILRERGRRNRTRKRGGGRKEVSLNPDLDDAPEPVLAVHRDERFDRIWVAHLVDAAIQEAERTDRRRGTRYMEVLAARTVDQMKYQELAARFRLSLQDVKNHLHRARLEVGRQVRRLVGSYASSLEEFREELEFVSDLMRGPRKGKPNTRVGDAADRDPVD